jgi:hypothetical protein
LCFVASTELRGVAWRARSSFYPCPHGRLPSCSPYKPLRCVCVPPTSQLEHVEVVSR